LKLAEFNRDMKGDDGEIARVKRRLSTALSLSRGCLEEAERLHEEAEKIRRDLQEPTTGKLPDNELSYDIMVATYYRGYHHAGASMLYHVKGDSRVPFSSLLS
jgi:hypothetical protein